MRFDEFDLGYDVLDALDAMRFEECTPIQEQAIGQILNCLLYTDPSPRDRQNCRMPAAA